MGAGEGSNILAKGIVVKFPGALPCYRDFLGRYLDYHQTSCLGLCPHPSLLEIRPDRGRGGGGGGGGGGIDLNSASVEKEFAPGTILMQDYEYEGGYWNT